MNPWDANTPPEPDPLGPENPSGSHVLPATVHDVREIKKVLVDAEWVKSIHNAAAEIKAAADKAKANGVVTREEATKDTKSTNRHTWGAAVGVILTIFAVAHYMIDPWVEAQKELRAWVRELQLDVRALYKAVPSERSERLEKPVEAAK